jgi:hypothetical protein
MILNVKYDLSDSYYANWYKFLSRWSLFTGICILGLFLGIFIFVLPASQNSPLPQEYFELVAAGQVPYFYRLTIAFDILAWLSQIGLFITFAALFVNRAFIRSSFIAVCALSMIVGFAGACLRLAGTSEFASSYLIASPSQKIHLLQSYSDLLRLINILFTAGGLTGSIALLLATTVAWSMVEFKRWSIVLIGISGVLQLLKAVGELATGIDLGPLALLAGILLIVALFAISIKHWIQTKIS